MDRNLSQKPVYRRALLKLSGEALQNDASAGIDAAKLAEVSMELAQIAKLGVQIAIVIGGGNIIRGSDFSLAGIDRITADQMGMLATIINGLALRDALAKKQVPVMLMSAIAVPGLVEFYSRSNADRALNQGTTLIFVGGTGNPLVTTDSAAALRGIEIGADVLLKATKVDGVFAADPIKNPTAERYTELTYQEVFEKRLGVMDLNAILLCQDHALPLRVFNMNEERALLRTLLGEAVGTLIQGSKPNA